MSANITTFEVKVLFRDKNSKYYRCDLGKHCSREIIKMVYIEARTLAQAFEKAVKYGRPISANKCTASQTLERMSCNIEAKDRNGDYLVLKGMATPYKNAIDMGYFIWNKKKNNHRNDVDT